MEFLSKLLIIPRNVLKSLNLIRQKSAKIEQKIIEPILICKESRIDTFIEMKRVVESSTQTELKNEKLVKSPEPEQQSKKEKKLQKEQQKQDLSAASQQTEPSQYSYCQNHFLDALEQNEKEYNLDYQKLYNSAKRKSSKQEEQQLIKRYLDKLKQEKIRQKPNIDVSQDKEQHIQIECA